MKALKKSPKAKHFTAGEDEEKSVCVYINPYSMEYVTDSVCNIANGKLARVLDEREKAADARSCKLTLPKLLLAEAAT